MAGSYVPNMSGFGAGIGDIISGQISKQLQEKALGGDQSALVKLSSRDPNAANQIGDIFNQEKKQAKEARDLEQQFIPRIASGYNSATDKVGYLKQSADILRSQGMEKLALDIEDDIARYEIDPKSVDMEYDASLSMFSDPTKAQAKVAAIQDREDKINSLEGAENPITKEPFTKQTARQYVVMAETGMIARAGSLGASERGALDKNLGDAVTNFEAGKAGAIASAKESTEGGQLSIQESRMKMDQQLRDASRKAVAVDFDVDAALGNIDKLLSGDAYKSIYGRGEKFYPEIFRSQDSMDALALRDQIVGLVSLESREKLKGQGTITDSEAAALERSATILANPSISDKLAKAEIERVRSIFQSKRGASSSGQDDDLLAQAEAAIAAGAPRDAVMKRLEQLRGGK